MLQMDDIDAEIKNGLLVCLSICAADGLISTEEEEVLEASFMENFGLPKLKFQEITDFFFADKDQFENYLDGVFQKELKTKFIDLSKKAAEIDGLDIKENVAWEKCRSRWGDSIVSNS